MGRFWIGVLLLVACGDGGRIPDGVRSGSRLRAVFLQAEGVRSFVGWHDRERGERCSFQRLADGSTRCLPNVSWSSTYADAACTQPILEQWVGDECGPPPAPAYFGVYLNQTCGGGLTRIVEAVPVADRAMVYDLGTDGCVGRAPYPDYDHFAAGAEIPIGSFVRASPVVDDRTGRVQVVYLQAEDGARQIWGMEDGELDTGCSWWASDSEPHCFPDDVTGTYLWGDSSCTEPLMTHSTVCDAPVPRFVVDFVHETCGGTLVHFERVAEHTGDVYETVDTSCALHTSVDEMHYDLGAAISPDDFAVATRGRGDETGRLQAYWLQTDDGLTVPSHGFYDTQRDEPCNPAASPAGLRCVPEGGASVAFGLFADPGCTEPAGILWTFCEPPPVPHTATAYSCIPRPDVFEVVEELAPGEAFSGSPDACSATSWDTAMYRLYRLGDAIPLEDFAELREVVD